MQRTTSAKFIPESRFQPFNKTYLTTSRESEKNIFCHYRSINIKFSVDFDRAPPPRLRKRQKTKWRPDRKWFVTWKNKYQIRAQEVKRYRIDMFILHFDQFLEKNKMAARPEVVRCTKKTKPDSCSGGPRQSEKHFYLILIYFDENPK